MTETADQQSSRRQKKEQEHRENREHWLAEEQKIYDLWERAYNPGGQAQNDRLGQQGKKPRASSSGSSSIRERTSSS
jgi:hypothetical protein